MCVREEEEGRDVEEVGWNGWKERMNVRMESTKATLFTHSFVPCNHFIGYTINAVLRGR